MKIKLFLIFFGLFICGAYLNAQSLDEMIINAAVKISRDLPANVKVAIINFRSDSEKLNNYVINELYGAILRNRRIIPVISDQSQLQSIRGDLPSNTADTINRESAQRIGRLLGVRYLITGSVERVGSEYKINFTAFNADNAEIQSRYSDNVIIDNNLFSLPDSSTPVKGGAEPAKQEQVPATVPASTPDSSTPVKGGTEPAKQEQVPATAPDSEKKSTEKKSALLASIGFGGDTIIGTYPAMSYDINILFIGKSGFTISTGINVGLIGRGGFDFIAGVGYVYYKTFYIGGILNIVPKSRIFPNDYYDDYGYYHDWGTPLFVPTIVFGWDIGSLLLGGQVSYVLGLGDFTVSGFKFTSIIGISILDGRN